MKRPRWWAVAVLLGGAIACSGSSADSASCASLACPKDPPIAESTLSQCESGLSQCGGYQAYLNCEVSQIKCKSDGTIDAQASGDAVNANCASQADRLMGCAIFSVSNCGVVGERCCESGAACENGCCDAGQCVLDGQSCSGGTAFCTGGACTPCGAPGQTCCPAAGDRSPCGYGCCVPAGTCIDVGTACPSNGGATTVCAFASCQSCGAGGMPCCPGESCPGSTSTSPLYCVTGSASMGGSVCRSCGGDGDDCCPGSTCPGSTTAVPLSCITVGGTSSCSRCGNLGAPCCTTGCPCNTSFPCNPNDCVAGTCQ